MRIHEVVDDIKKAPNPSRMFKTQKEMSRFQFKDIEQVHHLSISRRRLNFNVLNPKKGPKFIF